jgi:L-fuculokinase
MVRSTIDTLKIPDRNSGVTIEWDALPGLVNPGVQWVASGVMEWITRLFFSDLSANSDRYSIMIREAASVPPGCHGTAMIPELFPGGFTGRQGALKGLSHETTRAHIYRAGLEALSFYLAYGLEKLQRVGNFTAHDIICVGGGSKNVLWNQIRADILGRSLKIPDVKEATALGAALLAFTGIGMYRDLEEALFTVKNTYEIIEPSENREVYMKLYEAFINEAFPNKTAP